MAARNGNYDLARSYRDRYGIDMPTLKLARIMYNENRLAFTNVETARSALRKIEGKSGKKLRGEIGQKQYFMEEHRPNNPYNLPDSDETIYEPFILDSKRLLVLSDIHIPYHSIPALTAAFDWAKTHDPDVILLNGDTIDCHQLSRFVRDPKKRKFASELKLFKKFIVSLKATFPNAKIVFKAGNHEERYDHFLMMKAGELKGVKEFELKTIIEKRGKGVGYVNNKRIIRAGKLNIIHGHEFGGTIWSPVNIARGLFLKGKVSCMQGHNHQTSEHTEPNMNGEITTTWSVGCLSELHPEYLPLNKWNHGFAFVEIADNGDFDVQNKRILNGKVL